MQLYGSDLNSTEANIIYFQVICIGVQDPIGVLVIVLLQSERGKMGGTWEGFLPAQGPVSYTHLTLPTKA